MIDETKTTTTKERERKNQELVIDYEEKGNRRRGKEKHTLKRYSAIGEIQRMSPEQGRNSCKSKMEKKRLRPMIKEIGKSEGRNERKSKFKN